VKGIALGHPLPHLSHLGVRARQARVPFAACADREHLQDFAHLVGKNVRLRVSADGISVQEEARPSPPGEAEEPVRQAVTVPDVILAEQPCVLTLDQATPPTCGAKAAGAKRLLELASESSGLFRAPRGLALPFGVMERCLDGSRAHPGEYDALQERLPHTPRAELGKVLGRLRELLLALSVPDAIGTAVTTFFGPKARLAVRSSANGEDLEHLAGAGLYESVVNVPAVAAPAAIARVWASLWTRRATVSRIQAGIAHAGIHMAVLLQELVTPDLSFIMHTVNPLTGSRDEALVELAVGLGEGLASSCLPGTPYRLVCDRKTGGASLSTCANFSVALRPAFRSDAPGLIQERLDYSKVPLSSDPGIAEQFGKRLADIAGFLEEKLGGPQDVEGVCVGEDIYIVQARPQQGLCPEAKRS
jgi:phosphoglucan,water dikinase